MKFQQKHEKNFNDCARTRQVMKLQDLKCATRDK